MVDETGLQAPAPVVGVIVRVGVLVVTTGVFVRVAVGPVVDVRVGVLLMAGVSVRVGVLVTVDVRVGVLLTAGVRLRVGEAVGVNVAPGVTVRLAVGVIVAVPVLPQTGSPPQSKLPLAYPGTKVLSVNAVGSEPTA